jgi:putative tricarboxylic transport membrane protein
MLETSLQQSLLISQGSWLIFFNRPIAAFFMALAFLSIARGVWLQVRSPAPEVALDEGDD